MNFDRTSEPPDQPFQTSELTPLSPASPKPLHFPAPTNIPILEMQTDVDFNQTEPHMADPAMRNTEVRPNLWRDPNEAQETGDYASPFSTGGEAMNAANETLADDAEPIEAGEIADGADIAANGAAADSEPVQASNDASHQANASLAIPSSSDETTVVVAEQPVSAVEPTALSEAHPEHPQTTTTSPFGANVDVQSLLETLQVPPSASTSVAPGVTPSTPAQTHVSASGPGASPSSASAASQGVPSSGLPPRPPPQEQPLMNQNYVHSQHIRDYHPHAAHSAFQPQQQNGSQGNAVDSSSRSYVPLVHSPTNPMSTTGPQAQAQAYPYSPASASFPLAGAPSAQPQTPTSAFTSYPYNAQGAQSTVHSVASSTPLESRREHKLAAGETPTAEDRPWDAETQAKYDRFIETERGYVSEGRWEQFPMGSRLFVGTRNLDGTKTRKDEVTLVDEDAYADGMSSSLGNLSSEKVTKRDIFHVFWRYGELAQISIKQAYGFVQFLSADECKKALDAEQGRQIRDKRIHLEISTPQKNRAGVQNLKQGRRSRSPDYGRGGRPQSGADRYAGRDQGRGGAGGYNNNRGYRSPSPPRGYRDRHDDRGYRDRSPPYSRGGGRYRSPSPRRSEDDDLPLPKRAPREVPDVQIIVLDSLERDFISWVEKAFSARSVRVDVLILSPRLSEQAVIRRQIVEGVVAVVKLTNQNQNTGKIGLQIFDRSGGQGLGSVKYEEYENLDPPICVELVLRAKQTQAAPAPTYGGYGQPPPQQPQYGAQPQQPQYLSAYSQAPQYAQQPPAHAAYPPAGYPAQQQPPPQQNVQNLITNLDPSGLQSLLSTMGNQQSPSTPAGYGQPGGYQQQQQAAMAALQQSQAQQQQQGGQVNMQDILAKLGSYRQ